MRVALEDGETPGEEEPAPLAVEHTEALLVSDDDTERDADGDRLDIDETLGDLDAVDETHEVAVTLELGDSDRERVPDGLPEDDALKD